VKKKIKYLISLSGPHYNVIPGAVCLVEAAEADRLIAAGFAVEIVEKKAAAK
jgi:hypothetical protein